LPSRTEIELTDTDYLPADAGPDGAYGTVILLGQRATAFGATAPHKKYIFRNEAGAINDDEPDWEFQMGEGDLVDLDTTYQDAVPNRAILFSRRNDGDVD